MAVIVDSYSESNHNGASNIYSSQSFCGQSFTGNGTALTSAKFYLRKISGSPTGSCYSKIYSHTGTYGTSSEPNVLLATSNAVDVSTLSPSSYELKEFTFSGEEQIVLEDGSYYVLVFSYSGGDVGNYIACGLDGVSSSHSGNAGQWFSSSSSYFLLGDYDLIFYVYGEEIVITPIIGAKYPLPPFKRS